MCVHIYCVQVDRALRPVEGENFAFKMMNFVLQMIHSGFKTVNFALKMMNCEGAAHAADDRQACCAHQSTLEGRGNFTMGFYLAEAKSQHISVSGWWFVCSDRLLVHIVVCGLQVAEREAAMDDFSKMLEEAKLAEERGEDDPDPEEEDELAALKVLCIIICALLKGDSAF